MSAPYRAFAKLDAAIWRNDKVDTLRRRSPKAYGLWITAICYSVDNLTDGRITTRDVQRLGYRPQTVQILVDLGFFEEQEGGSYTIHDYLNHQTSSDTIRDRHRKDAQRKRQNNRETPRNVNETPRNAHKTDSAFQAAVGLTGQNPGELELELEPELHIDRQTTYVSNENQVCLSENHIPPVDPLTEEACARSGVDIDHEWEQFLEHINETGEQPRSWVNGFNGWLKQAVKYRDDHPSKDRRDDRTQAKFDHFITAVEKANHYEVSTIQQGILRKAYFDQSLTCHSDGLRALVDTCVSLDLTLPHEQQKI